MFINVAVVVFVFAPPRADLRSSFVVSGRPVVVYCLFVVDFLCCTPKDSSRSARVRFDAEKCKNGTRRSPARAAPGFIISDTWHTKL